MTRRVLILIAGAALCATAVHAGKKYDPFKIPRDQFVGQVKTVALRQVSGISKDYPRSDSVKAAFESLLTAELERAGLKVIPGNIYEHLWQEGLDSLGGALFDPKTGARDTTRSRQVRIWSLGQLKARHHADALLHPTFAPMIASFSNGTAHWDGASQKLWKGAQGFLGVLDKKSGSMGALSLVVVIEDTEGKNLYVDSGGLSLMSRITGTRFEELPEDSLYWNPQRNAESVRLALGSLTRPAVK